MPSRRDPETGLVRRGTSNSNERGSAETRRRRKWWLIETYRADVTGIRVTYADEPIPQLATSKIGTTEMFVPEPEDFSTVWATYVRIQQVHGYIVSLEEVPLARCFHCGIPLSFETVTVDRIIPGCKGGTYRRNNIRPACSKHNSELGAPMANGKEHQAAKRAAKRKKRPAVQTLVAVGLMLAALTGCGQNTLDGTVTGKDVDAGYFYTYFLPMTSTTCSGSPPTCRTYTSSYIPILYWVPPCYEIAVDGDTKDATGTACLDESEWNGIEVGDHYTGPDVKPRDRQQEKSRG